MGLSFRHHPPEEVNFNMNQYTWKPEVPAFNHNAHFKFLDNHIPWKIPVIGHGLMQLRI